jgi:hypothetical protein
MFDSVRNVQDGARHIRGNDQENLTGATAAPQVNRLSTPAKQGTHNPLVLSRGCQTRPASINPPFNLAEYLAHHPEGGIIAAHLVRVWSVTGPSGGRRQPKMTEDIGR